MEVKPKTTKMQNATYSFNRGWVQVRQCDTQECKKALMEALHITSAPSWCARKNGEIEPKVSEKEAIERVFAQFGIKKDIWGF